MKRCTKCGEIKPIDAYSVQRRSKSGVRAQCKVCSYEAYKSWKDNSGYFVDSEKRNKYMRDYRRINGPSVKEYMREYMLRWSKENEEKVTAKTARYRSAKLKRTVPWSDSVAIDFVYFSAGVIAKFYGGCKPVVDHIIPLQGKLVSGLHVAENLQLISATQNAEKGNNYDPLLS